jgi:tetratricopeptide (TPR) repeat protein
MGGQYVSYEQLIRDAWGGTVVSQHTVSSTVGDVRKALGEYGRWISYRPKLGYRFQVPGSDELIRAGWHLVERRSRQGFEKAMDYFRRAVEADSSDFRAFEGLSFSYLMLGLYGMRPPHEMYSGFLDAHARAVALAGCTPQLRANRAHGLHIFERKFDEAESEFTQALREDPSYVSGYVRLALLYATLCRLDKALEVLAQARRIDPLWPTLSATEVFLRLCRREFDAAVLSGKQGLDLHPYLHLARGYYAQALEYSNQPELALAQYRLAHVIEPDIYWVRALEARCLAIMGRKADAETVLEELEETRLSEYVDAYYMALLFEALGRRDDAIEELDRAIDENSATLYMLDVDPKMDPLRGDRRFAKLRNRLF